MALWEETARLLAGRGHQIEVLHGAEETGETVLCGSDGQTELRFSGSSVRLIGRELCRPDASQEQILLCLNALNHTHPFCNLHLRGGAVEQTYYLPDETMTDAAALCELFEYEHLLAQRVTAFFQRLPDMMEGENGGESND